MKLKTAFIVCGITLSLGNIGYAQTDLSELNWLAGYWTATTDGNTTEEFWTHVSGGMMLGLNRRVSSSGRASFEFLRIVQEEDVITYLASPEGRSVTSFELKEHAPGKALFENPEHDFPQRIVYSLENDSTLIARIEGEIDGELRHMEWRWSKTEIAKRTLK